MHLTQLAAPGPWCAHRVRQKDNTKSRKFASGAGATLTFSALKISDSDARTQRPIVYVTLHYGHKHDKVRLHSRMTCIVRVSHRESLQRCKLVMIPTMNSAMRQMLETQSNNLEVRAVSVFPDWLANRAATERARDPWVDARGRRTSVGGGQQ